MADASFAWNQTANSNNFKATTATGVGSTTTFVQAYTGSNFRTDFDTQLAATASTMGTDAPGASGDDLMISTLENWPES